MTAPLSVARLNRTLLARQLLLRRTPVSLPQAVGRLCALQAQYAPSPYVALWTRLPDFHRDQLTRAFERGTIVKASLLRSTLHVVTRRDYPYVASAYVEAQRGRTSRLDVDLEALAATIPDKPLTSRELFAIAGETLGTDDRWAIAFALRGVPSIRLAPTGAWPHHRPSPELVWREPLPAADESAKLVVRRYLAGYGPASREDVEQFTGFRRGQIDPALDGLRRFEDEQGRTLVDLPRLPLARESTPAPVRFLPPYDSIILAHRDRSRILPADYRDVVIRKKNATTLATFLVGGFVAGAWRMERTKANATLVLEPFAPIHRREKRAIVVEGERLVRFLHEEAAAYSVRFA